jgi:hypothetical protein
MAHYKTVFALQYCVFSLGAYTAPPLRFEAATGLLLHEVCAIVRI